MIPLNPVISEFPHFFIKNNIHIVNTNLSFNNLVLAFSDDFMIATTRACQTVQNGVLSAK